MRFYERRLAIRAELADRELPLKSMAAQNLSIMRTGAGFCKISIKIGTPILLNQGGRDPLSRRPCTFPEGNVVAGRTFLRPCRCCACLAAMAMVPNRQKPRGPPAIAWWPGGLQTPKPVAADSPVLLLATTASTSACAAPAACMP